MAGLFSLRTNKIIFTEHGWPFNALESINFLIIYLLQIILSPLCKTIICTSDTLYKKLYYKVNKLTLYNTIRSDYLNFKRFEKINLEKTFKLGMVARLSPQKDIKRFINLAENFSNNESFEFYLAGDGLTEKKSNC